MDAVVVAGATGTVGRRITRSLLSSGYRVLAQGRSADRLVRLRDETPATLVERLDIVACSLQSDIDVDVLAGAVSSMEANPIAAVACLGGWYVGEHLLNLPVEQWQDTIAGNLTSHFVAARAVVPQLIGSPDGRRAPAYVMMNGIAGRKACIGSGAISVAGAGQTMLKGVVRAEGSSVRIRELIVLADIAFTEQDDPGSSIAFKNVHDAILAMVSDDGAGDVVLMPAEPDDESE